MRVRILFEPRDLWIGVYWTRVWTSEEARRLGATSDLRIYLCLIPCLPIVLDFPYRIHVQYDSKQPPVKYQSMRGPVLDSDLPEEPKVMPPQPPTSEF